MGKICGGSPPGSELEVPTVPPFRGNPETGGENYDLLFKIQSENMKITLNIGLFIFCMIYNFSKCDGFTVL